MDSSSNQITGVNLPDPTGGQGAAAGSLGAAGAPQQAASTAPPVPTMDAATDEELDQIWVNKAKDIVEQTRTDPFTQSNELNKVKAEYLKVRFDKDLNVGDKTPQ